MKTFCTADNSNYRNVSKHTSWMQRHVAGSIVGSVVGLAIFILIKAAGLSI